MIEVANVQIMCSWCINYGILNKISNRSENFIDTNSSNGPSNYVINEMVLEQKNFLETFFILIIIEVL
jgi:hypothetical protein